MIPRAAIASQLSEAGYIADRDLSTALWMMDHLSRPLLIEGEAGVGKTEVAKALAKIHACELIRMQCYEGIDVNSAMVEVCGGKGLEAETGDALTYLRGLPDASLGGLFAAQVVEEDPLTATLTTEQPHATLPGCGAVFPRARRPKPALPIGRACPRAAQWAESMASLR